MPVLIPVAYLVSDDADGQVERAALATRRLDPHRRRTELALERRPPSLRLGESP